MVLEDILQSKLDHSLGLPEAEVAGGVSASVLDHEPGDVRGWQEAISYLRDNPEKAVCMGQNARKAVEQGLNLDSFVQDFAELVRATA